MRPKFFNFPPTTMPNKKKIRAHDNVTTVGRIVFSQ